MKPGRVVEIAQNLLSGSVTGEQAIAELSAVTAVPPSYCDLVHFLYHYAADEDIRQRDSEYADFQRRRLQELLRGVA